MYGNHVLPVWRRHHLNKSSVGRGRFIHKLSTSLDRGLLSLFFSIYSLRPELWSQWWMLRKQIRELSQKRALIFLPALLTMRTIESSYVKGIIAKPADSDCNVSITVNSNEAHYVVVIVSNQRCCSHFKFPVFPRVNKKWFRYKMKWYEYIRKYVTFFNRVQ